MVVFSSRVNVHFEEKLEKPQREIPPVPARSLKRFILDIFQWTYSHNCCFVCSNWTEQRFVCQLCVRIRVSVRAWNYFFDSCESYSIFYIYTHSLHKFALIPYLNANTQRQQQK